MHKTSNEEKNLSVGAEILNKRDSGDKIIVIGNKYSLQ